MEEKKTNNVIGTATPVVDEVENIGVINPDILNNRAKVEEKEEPKVEQAQQTEQQQSQQAQQVYQQHQQYYNADDVAYQNKKILAGIMGIVFGAFGVHNFIYGYTGKGIAQVLITFLSCFMLSWVSAIWGLIEGIMILTDGIKPNN